MAFVKASKDFVQNALSNFYQDLEWANKIYGEWQKKELESIQLSYWNQLAGITKEKLFWQKYPDIVSNIHNLKKQMGDKSALAMLALSSNSIDSMSLTVALDYFDEIYLSVQEFTILLAFADEEYKAQLEKTEEITLQ